MFNNLRELITSMPTEETCREYLAKQRWPDGKVICPYCSHGHSYTIEGGKRYKCASKTCYKRFTVTVGTIMEASNIPVSKWLTAIYLVTAHKRGISTYQLGRDLGIAQKNAWFMLHRIREMMKGNLSRKLDNVVEADETYVGGSIANKHISERKKYAENKNWQSNKTTVLGMIERNGEALAKVIVKENEGEIEATVRENLEFAAKLVTDSHNFYTKLNDEYYHYTVNHSLNEFVRADFHTNTIEGMFSHFKRSVYGTYFHISPKHTQRYLDEFIHRYNSRKITDAERFTLSFSNVERRLTYKTLIAEPISQIIAKPVKKAKFKPVIQRKGDEVIGQYFSLAEAEKQTGIYAKNISKVIRGKRKAAGGFQWECLFE